MNKDYFIQLADYNIWANKIVHDWFNHLTEEQWKLPMVSSFESIEATALHIAGAETAWLGRLNNEASPVWLPSVFKGGKPELIALWMSASAGLKNFIEQLQEDRLYDGLAFKRINGEQVTLKYYQIFAHVFNHSTYHRGQLVTLLRQAGYTNISATDIMMYFRK
jgi:uncharacterized damage-inducible protein DinB